MQVHHDRQILVSLLDGNFIDGNVCNPFQGRFAKISFESAFFNVSHSIPRQTKMFGNVLTRHGKEQIENISFEESCASSMFFGKGDFDLLFGSAVVAMDAWNFEDNGGVFASEGEGTKASFFGSLLPNVGGAATGAEQCRSRDGKEKRDTAWNNLLAKVGIASNTVHVIQ